MKTRVKTVVKRYKGERELEHGIASMARRGYRVQDRTSRKKVVSVVTGPFTRQQIHTVTFVKEK